MKLMNQIVVALCAALVALSPIAAGAQAGASTPKKEGSLLPLDNVKSKAETDDFNAILSSADPVTVLGLSDAFMAKFGASQLGGEVMGRRMDAYLSLKKWSEAVDELEKALAFNKKLLADKTKDTQDKNSPELAKLSNYNDSKEIEYYRRITDVAQSANNTVVADYFGMKILEKLPNDCPALMTVARVKAQKPPADPKEKEAALDLAEEMGQAAVNCIVGYLNSPNSAGLKPEMRTEWAYRAHSLMGLIYNQKQRYGDAAKAYSVALSIRRDGAAYYYLGYAYYQEKKYDAAIEAALKSAFLKGPLELNAKELLIRSYQAIKKPTANIDKDIQAAGARMAKF